MTLPLKKTGVPEIAIAVGQEHHIVNLAEKLSAFTEHYPLRTVRESNLREYR